MFLGYQSLSSTKYAFCINLDLVDEYALNEKLTGQFDELQSIGKCCGITDWADFIKTPWSRLPENELTVLGFEKFS